MTRPPGTPPTIVAIEGVSGVGKTTVARAVARRIRGRFIAEAYHRLDPAPSLAFRTRRELGRIELALADQEGRRFVEATGTRARGVPAVLDTATLGPLTYAWGIRAINGRGWDVLGPVRARLEGLVRRGRWGVPDRVVYLEADPDTVDERLSSDPVGHPEEFRGRHARVGAFERRLWLTRLARRLPGRVDRVDASGPPERVARAVVGLIESPTETAGSLEAHRALRAFRPSPHRGQRAFQR